MVLGFDGELVDGVRLDAGITLLGDLRGLRPRGDTRNENETRNAAEHRPFWMGSRREYRPAPAATTRVCPSKGEGARRWKRDGSPSGNRSSAAARLVNPLCT